MVHVSREHLRVTFLLILFLKLFWDAKLVLQMTGFGQLERSLMLAFVGGPSSGTASLAEQEEGSSDPLLNPNLPQVFSHHATTTVRRRTSPQAGLVLFYHISLLDKPLMVMSTVKQQLSQIGASGARSSSDKLMVYYTTVGNQTISQLDKFESQVLQICSQNKLQCLHQSHYQEGLEFVTLQQVHKHCREAPNDTVMYLHNSQSSPTLKPSNDRLRRSMITAISSKECHFAVKKQPNACNICGLTFSPWQAPLFPGNFWTASCRYIAQLLDPYEYQNRTVKIERNIRHMKNSGKLTANLFPKMPSTMGSGPYGAEFWVGSHPAIRPCDVVPGNSHHRFKNVDLSLEEIDLQPAPRANFTVEAAAFLHKIPNTTQARAKEYFLAVGYLLRWNHNYHQLPTDGSWFWKFFPDGDLWKEAIQQNKTVHRAISHMVSLAAPL